MDARTTRWMAAAFGLLTLAVYWPSLGGGWLNWDDPATLLDNPHWRGLGADELRWMWSTVWVGHYMPLAWMTLALNHQIGGLDPFGYHLGNVLLHAGSAALWVAVLARLLPRTHPAGIAAGAAFFAWHPLRVEPVGWISDRSDVLAMTLGLGALLAWLRHTERGDRGSYLAALGLQALSLASKAHLMSFPLVLLVLDVYPLRRELGLRRRLLEKLPFFVPSLAAAAMALRAKATAGGMASLESTPIAERLGNAAHGASVYPGRMLAPLDLSPLYGRVEQADLPIWVAATALAVVTLSLVAAARRAPGALSAWGLYLLLILPTSGLLQAGLQLTADRYTYFAGLPFAALLAGATGVLAERARWLLVPVGLWLAALGAGTWSYAHVWRSSVSLWWHAAQRSPDDPRVAGLLANALDLAGHPAEALPWYEVTLASELADDVVVAYADALRKVGRPADALRILAQVPERNDQRRPADLLAGRIHAEAGRWDEAVAQLEPALHQRVDDAPARDALVQALRALGRADEAARWAAAPVVIPVADEDG